MTQLKHRLQSQPQGTAPRRASRPANWLNDTDNKDSVRVGLALSVVVWLLLLWVFNVGMGELGSQHVANHSGQIAPKPRPPVLDFQLEPEPAVSTPPPPDRFVETNPDAPENIPDNTRNFGAQNQQVAQEKPTPGGKSDTPATEGKKDWESNQIVRGQLAPPELPVPQTPPPTPEIKESATVTENTPAQREKNPLSGTEKLQGESETGYGSNISKTPEDAKNITPDVNEPIKGQPDAPQETGLAQAAQPRIDPQHPQPRARVHQNVRPAVLAENKFGTENIGPVAFDARWSNYGQYLQKLIESVQVQWERLIENSRVSPPSGTKVTVKFRINSEGNIAEVVDADGSGGTQATRICVSAITDRAPYGKWTDDMVAMLGDSQELTFTFYYGMP